MNRNEIVRNNSKTGEFPKVQDDNATNKSCPYYWSWYGIIFTRAGSQPGDKPTVTIKKI